MNDFFTFKMNNQNTEKKLWAQVVKVAIIVGVCLMASFAVSSLVHDRIERNERALDSVKGLQTFLIDDGVAVFGDINQHNDDGSKQVVSSQFKYGVFDNTTIDVKEMTYKKLGKQNVPVFKGHIVSTGSFERFFGNITSNGSKNNSGLTIAISESAKDIVLSINGKVIKDYKQDKVLDSYIYIVLSDNILKSLNKSSTISLSYDFTALAKIENYESRIEQKVEIHTNTSNIRLSNSSNSHFDKASMTAMLDIRPGDYQTGVIFLSGADDITLVDRIIKYAILFIVLVFALAVFMDIKSGFIVNTLQYFLVGASLALFYLLTLALGEEIGYTYAYIIGSVGTALLNMWFVGGIFNSKKIGYVFAAVLLALYGVLYVIVRLDSISLLLGTGLLYAVLVAFMIAAKKSNRL